jgi:hypothetical protein
LIDQRFVERRPDFPGQLGEPIVVSADEVTSVYDLVGELRDLLKSGVESSHGITLDMLRQAFEASESEHAGRADVSG